MQTQRSGSIHMSRDSRRAPASRCLLVWSVVTVATTTLLHLVRSDLVAAREVVIAPAGQSTFAPVLVAVATLALGVSAAWLWCVTTAATLEAFHGVHRVELPGLRGAVRRVVLAGCGVAVAATVAPAHADEVRHVSGQPPEPLTAAVSAPAPGRTHVIAPGDTLWEISEARLGQAGATPSTAEVDQAWRGLWHANEAAIGADPDRILSGQRLEIPESLR